MDTVESKVYRYRVEENEEWHKWGNEAPWLQFPPELEVKIVPPFGGAMARFRARFVGGEREVSVYWDCHDALGYMEKPYWEIHPVKSRGLGLMDEADVYDCKRFLAGEESDMMVSIIKSLMDEYDE